MNAIESEHYMSLEAHESEHEHIDCGCVLRFNESASRTELIHCPMHDAAHSMLEALKTLAHEWEYAHTDEEIENALVAARAEIAKAEGK